MGSTPLDPTVLALQEEAFDFLRRFLLSTSGCTNLQAYTFIRHPKVNDLPRFATLFSGMYAEKRMCVHAQGRALVERYIMAGLPLLLPYNTLHLCPPPPPAPTWCLEGC
uniref:Uncharacterized protein n=1 Tax=Eutreptiella gymnastica TaxID=73025 RepID=A0A7S1J6H3_9EUGL|mmetsp:Transcript_71904/g.126705  ORF Transcript_71904/g.126705 Transcript_71904/m.126705 type:complete len:109 (+) Transcript_71904:611-937(+)